MANLGEGWRYCTGLKGSADLSYVLSTHKELDLQLQHRGTRDRRIPGGQPALLVWLVSSRPVRDSASKGGRWHF